MKLDHLFVDVQGFKSYKNEFIIKEFAYSTNEYTQTFLIKPPYSFSNLTENEKRQVKWIEKNLGIMWREGYIDHREFKRMIRSYLEGKKIFVKGFEKIRWINDLCADCTVIDLGEKGCPNFQLMYKEYCINDRSYNCLHHKKNCALKNVICLKKCYFDILHTYLKL